MKYFSKEFPSKSFSLIPLGDTHLGSPQCNKKFFLSTVERIEKERDTYCVLMGDLVENALVGSVGDIYEQTSSPQEQVEEVESILEPIKHKILFTIIGNHEQRTTRVAGLKPTAQIASNLKIPFGGFSCYARFTVDAKYGVFTAYFHHNTGGGYTKGGKTNRSVKLREITPTADATFSGHMHVTARTPTEWYECRRKGVHKCIGYDYIIGSALDYDESYAEMRAKPPASTEFIKVSFIGSNSGRYDNRRQLYEIILPQGVANG